MSYKCNNNITYSCKYHVIWCSKYRRKVLVEEVGQRLKELIVGVASELRVDIIEVDPQFGIHRAVKNIKGKTSRILRAEFISLRTRLPSLWTNSYFVATVGGAPLEVIKQYIESQKYV